MAQQYEDGDSGIVMSPNSATSKRSNLLDKDHDDDHEAETARRLLFQEQQKRENRMQQTLEAARKRMESGRNTIERMMQEETARTQKMERLEAESEELKSTLAQRDMTRTLQMERLEAESQRLKSILSEREMAIVMLTQTVVKERERFNNERAVSQKRITTTDNTETEPAETLYVDDSLGVVSRKRKKGMPTPLSSDVAALTADNDNNDDETYTFDLNDGSDEDIPVVSSSPLPSRARAVACANLQAPQTANVVSESNTTSGNNGAPKTITSSSFAGRIRGISRRTRTRPVPIARVYNLRPRKPINYKV